MLMTTALGFCQFCLQVDSEEDLIFLDHFLHHYSELLRVTPKEMADISIKIQRVTEEIEKQKLVWATKNRLAVQENAKDRSFLYFKEAKDTTEKLFLYIQEQAALWHLERKGLALHSAAVAMPTNDGFLFLGDSGAGKTTVGQFCHGAGWAVLGDDTNFLIGNDKNGYLLHFSPTINRPPYPYSDNTPSLKAIFLLQQDTSDYLVRQSPKTIASYLYNSFQALTFTHRIPDEYQQKAFEICTAVAKQVPGFELHFTNSEKFLDIIKSVM
jgi:hypothetical protein